MATESADALRRSAATAPGGRRRGVARQIDRDSFEPAYSQLTAILRGRIADGEFLAGDRLPTEAELIAAYGLSPMTVRRAIRILVDEGAVSATRGRGTFVEPASIASATFDLGSFRALLTDPTVDVRMLSVGMASATGRISRLLEVPVGARVIRIQRLLSRDGAPLLYHREWLRYDPRQPVVESELGLTALGDLFEGRGSTGPKRGRFALQASTLWPKEAEQLKAMTGEAAFLVEHQFYGFDDLPLSWGFFVCRGDLLTFETTVGFAPRPTSPDTAPATAPDEEDPR